MAKAEFDQQTLEWKSRPTIERLNQELDVAHARAIASQPDAVDSRAGLQRIEAIELKNRLEADLNLYKANRPKPKLTRAGTDHVTRIEQRIAARATLDKFDEEDAANERWQRVLESRKKR